MKHRWWARLRAWALGFFWLECPSCGEMFGGHEVTDPISVQREIDDEAKYVVCPDCAAAATICPLCKQMAPDVERRHMSTAYHDKEMNYTTSCWICFQKTEEHWKDQWADYYASVM